MWFIGVEVEQETSAPPPKKNPGSAPDTGGHEGKRIALHCKNQLTGKWSICYPCSREVT